MNVGSLFSVSGVLIPVANVPGHVPHTIKQLNSMLTLSTSRWHQIPQAKGLVSQESPPPTSDTSHKSKLSPLLLTYQLQTGGFNNPYPMCSINLLEHFTELKETFYLLDYQFIKKGYKQADERDVQGKGYGEGCVPSPGGQLSQHLHFHQTRSSLNLSLSVFMVASLHRHE